MSTYDATEQEEIEKLKHFWSRYGRFLSLALLIGLMAYLAVTGWQTRQHHIQLAASELYQQLMKETELTEGNPQPLAKRLMQEYPHSTYAIFAAFSLAKIAVEIQHWDEAILSLDWALKHTTDPYLQFLATSRLARIHLTENKIEEAWTLLQETRDNGPYRAQWAELKGDVLLAKGDLKKAQEAYQIALAALPEQANNRLLLQIKLDDLAQGEPIK